MEGGREGWKEREGEGEREGGKEGEREGGRGREGEGEGMNRERMCQQGMEKVDK